jgi:eukaryotic-like serine/threonine-protein kinase
MTPDRFQRVDEWFEHLLDLPAEMRERALDALRDEDSDLAGRVKALLDADAAVPTVLQLDAAGLAATLLEGAGGAVLPGRLGRYALREHLGEGGTGSVFLAQREDLGDLVALKFLNDPWSSPARRRRFGSEQRTLANLNHRSIARLYDAGVADARPWFAMEYVQGRTIVDHAAAHQLSLRQRLALFRDVCDAVSYAHRHLVVHLDLKPSNVLVTGEGEVKLVDFGIARQLATADGEAERTATGLRLLSLNYAAPEQIRGEALDVQADVHALGALLYELLAGRPPLDLTRLSAADLTRALDDDPPAPSQAADDRTVEGMHASRAQWKDLDALCLTALRRRKADRYQSVDQLGRDVEHFLNDEPLDARAGDRRYYRARKFFVRYRRQVGAVAAVTAVIAVLVGYFNWRLIGERDRALSSEQRALSSEARTERIHRLMLNLFEGDDSAAGPAEGLRVVSLLDRGVRGVDTLTREPDLQAQLRFTFGGLYHKLGHLDRAEPLLRAAWSDYRSLLGDDDATTMRAQIALALVHLDQARFTEAWQLTNEALQRAERRRAPAVEVAIARAAVGKVLTTQGQYQDAIPLLERAVGTLSAGPATVELSEALGDLANTFYYVGNINAAEALNQRGIVLDRSLFGERHPHTGIGLFNVGLIELDRGRYESAEALFRQSLDINTNWYGQAHPKTASAELMVGRTLAYRGDWNGAETRYRSAGEAIRAAYSGQHPRYGQVLSLRGDLARDRGAFVDAVRLFHEAAGVFEVLGQDHEFYLHQLSNLGSVEVARGRYADAERVLRPALIRLEAVVPGQRYTGLAAMRLAAALAGQRKYEAARPVAAAAYQTLASLSGSPGAELEEARRLLQDIDARLASGPRR